MTTYITQIRKRDGSVVPFNQSKITTAMGKAFLESKDAIDEMTLQKLSDTVVQHLEKMYSKDDVPSVEQTQNVVERVLMDDGLFDVAKSYIIYRYEHAKTREMKQEKTEKKESIIIDENSLSNLPGEVVVLYRKESAGLKKLLNTLVEKKVINKKDVENILSSN